MPPATLQHRTETPEKFGGGMGLSVTLHLLLFGAAFAAAWTGILHTQRWGGPQANAGAIQASLVSAIPLPQRAAPVEKSVLAPEHASEAPAPPKEATQPPPKPTDIEVKARTQPTKAAPVETPEPPKHAQPTPTTTKAVSGEVATQIPTAIDQVKNGTASLTVPDRVYGARFAWYFGGIGRKVAQNYLTDSINVAASNGKTAVVVFDIEHDGTVQNLRLYQRSGSTSLDAAAMAAIQRIDTFGPLPAGDHITIQYKFDFHTQ
jgi:protein TonB